MFACKDASLKNVYTAILGITYTAYYILGNKKSTSLRYGSKVHFVLKNKEYSHLKNQSFNGMLGNTGCFFLFIYSLLTLGYRMLSKWFVLVRLVCVLSRAPSTDGSAMFTQSSLLASVFEVVDFLMVGGRGLLLVGCGDLSYDLYFSWPLL